MDAIVARLAIESQDSLSFFVTGSVAPTSDVGPWLKNGVTWYVWDVATGAYVPEVLEDLSVRYIASASAPDPAQFTFWIELNGSGKAIAIKYYYSGAWADIYDDRFSLYSTTAQTTAAISAANIRSVSGVNLVGDQTILANGGALFKIEFDTAFINPTSAFDTTNSRYVSPVAGYYQVSFNLQIDNVDCDVTQSTFFAKFVPNGNTTDILLPFCISTIPSPSGDRWGLNASGLVLLPLGQYVELWIGCDDGGTTHHFKVAHQSHAFFNLVQAV